VPRLSVFFIRTALLYLAAGFTLGGLLLANKGVPLTPEVWRLLPMHVEFVLVGWTVQLAMGVGFWILPRFLRPPARGDERPVWAAYLLLNLGVLSVAFGQWLAWPGLIPFIGRAAETVAVGLFAIHAWPRVKPQGV
jgi:hypothetical protein